MEKINNDHLRIATIEVGLCLLINYRTINLSTYLTKIPLSPSTQFEPWVKLVRNENGEIVDGKGLGFKILKTLIEPYNFT